MISDGHHVQHLRAGPGPHHLSPGLFKALSTWAPSGSLQLCFHNVARMIFPKDQCQHVLPLFLSLLLSKACKLLPPPLPLPHPDLTLQKHAPPSSSNVPCSPCPSLVRTLLLCSPGLSTAPHEVPASMTLQVSMALQVCAEARAVFYNYLA